ncbi:MAG: transcriptional regulator [Paenibacillus sp. RIFOXYA1_FULL_44_5]|nr:MAG: transcriptional regulator [Paenibacillus sp. RIFOXYA1_FULL_44_5]
MRNVSDVIEHHIKNILQQSPDGVIEIQRNELAEQFQCVPSQINYVISTRFSVEKGYIVESKRGGGGYIRIRRIDLPEHGALQNFIYQTIGTQIDQDSASGMIYQLVEAKLITNREAMMLGSAIKREVLQLKLPLRDEIRAKLLKAMLVALLSHS